MNQHAKPEAAGRAPRASDRIREELRDRILRLEAPPGSRLDESEIALRHGVSRTPVREALLALTQEDLVHVRPQSGTFVTRIDLASLPEAADARRQLEELTARRAAERGAPASMFGPSLMTMRQAALANDQEAFHAADDAFHSLVAEAAQTPLIGRITRQLRAPFDRYRRLTLPQPGRMRRVVDEHGAVVEAIAAGKPDAAAAAMAAHLGGLAGSFDAIRAAYPDFFLSAKA